jgi:hypothetical protein
MDSPEGYCSKQHYSRITDTVKGQIHERVEKGSLTWGVFS